jgi:acyl-CoA synthetase (AMP-forming)/AMP-acid ligase II
MDGLMMDYPLTLAPILRRAESLFGHKEVVTRRPDKSFHRCTYADVARRAKQLAVALQGLGLTRGDRVATLCWNQYEHLEAYFGIPLAGGVLHTVNPRLHESDLTYIVNDAEDRALIIDETLLPCLDRFRDAVRIEHVIVIEHAAKAPTGTIGYEELLARADPDAFVYPDLDEREAAAMCYTSGTTGNPKGVVYSHRALVLHTLGQAAAGPIGIQESDVILPVVPMFHVNAWGLPFTCTMVGATQVFPGPHLDAASLLEALSREHVTLTAGVPTIWLGLLRALDERPKAHDLSSLRALVVGGSAAPESMIRGFDERHGLRVVHAWGMTETTPLGTVSNLMSDLERADEDTRFRIRATQGYAVPFVEIRAQNEGKPVPWDGTSMGELEVRGPWVARAYYKNPGSADRFTADGWFRTGDIVTIDARGYVTIQDRSKDLIKSGGEWISSVALENKLMAHPAVAEAAVIAIPDERWSERPLAVILLKPGCTATPDELRAHLAPHFAKWWLPDGYEFVDEIPKTGVGKFRKTAIRERFAKRKEAAPAS